MFGIRRNIKRMAEAIKTMMGPPPTSPTPYQKKTQERERKLHALIDRHREVKKSVSGICYLRNQKRTELEGQGKNPEEDPEYRRLAELAEKMKGALLRIQAEKKALHKAGTELEKAAIINRSMDTVHMLEEEGYLPPAA